MEQADAFVVQKQQSNESSTIWAPTNAIPAPVSPMAGSPMLPKIKSHPSAMLTTLTIPAMIMGVFVFPWDWNAAVTKQVIATNGKPTARICR